MVDQRQLIILKQGAKIWNEWRQQNFHVKTINLSGADLVKAKLSGANLSNAYLVRAKLSGADLSRTDFSNAYLSRADFSRADLSRADLSGTKLLGANLSNTDLSGAKLSNTDLSGADLSGAKFSRINLSGADLSGINLSKADLSEANLSEANLSYTFLLEANLSKADLSYTNLSKADLSNTDLSKADLSEANLSGQNLLRADFSEANLSGADLSAADLSEADLSGADLSAANLITTQVIYTNFNGANFTGACIQNWNINSETNLENVICNYIYFKEGQQERRPSNPKKNFELGEFAKLVQKSLNTIDLIFSKGIAWEAVAYSIKNTQVLNEDTPLAIQSIENKGDGIVLIKVNVPQNADKGKIEGDFWQGYEFANKTLKEQYEATKEQYEARLLDNEKDITRLFTIVTQGQEVQKLMASASKNEYNFNAPVGSVGTQGPQTNVTGVVEGDQIGTQHNYPSEQKQTLSEAAAEIQKLLKQLEKSNPTATETNKIAYVNDETTPSFKRRVVNALKAGGETAIEEFLDNPYINVGKAIVKGWIKSE